MSDRERELMERDMYISRKRAFIDRQFQMINLLPKLIFPMILMLFIDQKNH